MPHLEYLIRTKWQHKSRTVGESVPIQCSETSSSENIDTHHANNDAHSNDENDTEVPVVSTQQLRKKPVKSDKSAKHAPNECSYCNKNELTDDLTFANRKKIVANGCPK